MGLGVSGLIVSGAGRRVGGTESRGGTARFTRRPDETTQLRADSRNSGYVPDAGAFERRPERHETHETRGETPAGVAVHDGIVYAVVEETDQTTGRLFRFDPAATGDWYSVIDQLGNCVPTVTSNYVFLNGTGRVLRVDNDGNPDGSETVESLQVDDEVISSSITWTSEWVYFTTSDRTLRAENIGSDDCATTETTSCERDGTVSSVVNGTPATDDGWAYASGVDGGLRAMDPDGVLWQIEGDGASAKYHPAVDESGEWVYTAMQDETVVLGVFRAKREGDDALRRKITVSPDGTPKTVSLAPNTAFVVVGRDGGDSVHAIDRTSGTERWRYDAAGSVYSPIVSAGTVLLTDDTTGLVGVDATDGTELWRHELSGVESHAAVSGERILVGCDEGVVEFRQQAGEVTEDNSGTSEGTSEGNPSETPTDTPTKTPTESPTDTITPTDTPTETLTDTPTEAGRYTETATQTGTPQPVSEAIEGLVDSLVGFTKWLRSLLKWSSPFIRTLGTLAAIVGCWISWKLYKYTLGSAD